MDEEETSQEPQIIEEEKPEESPQAEPPKNSGSKILIVVVVILVVILIALAYLGYRYINGTNPSATASKTSTRAAVTSATLSASTTSSISEDATPARDQALSVLARKHFDFVIAEQKSGDMIASEAYKNADYLAQSFKDEVKSRFDSWQMNPLTMSTEPITRYVIQGNYAQPNGTDGQIDCQVFSADKAWNVVLTAQKVNGVWLITDIGSAG